MGHSKDTPYIDEGRMEPLQLGLLEGMTPPEIEIEIFDDIDAKKFNTTSRLTW